VKIISSVCLLAAVLMTVAACGGGAPQTPPQSAARACKEFTAWYLAHQGNILSRAGSEALKQAVDAAPSGRLYRAMSTFRSDVQTAAAAPGMLQTGEKDLALTAALSVASQCQSVNPNS
jgi:hypothetical protein